MKSTGEDKPVGGKGRNRFVGIAVALVGAITVWQLFRFNLSAVGYNHYLTGNLIGLFFVPMLMILFVFREEPGNFGFGAGSSRRIWPVVGVLFLGLVAVMLYASRMHGFQDKYPWFRQFPEFWRAFRGYPSTNPYQVAPWLMLYGIASYGMYLLCWEFFFRGFLLLGLYRWIGWAAVVVQAAAFTLLHYGKPGLEMVAAFPAGIILGILALNARSFVPCFALHWAASILFDILAVVNRPH